MDLQDVEDSPTPKAPLSVSPLQNRIKVPQQHVDHDRRMVYLHVILIRIYLLVPEQEALNQRNQLPKRLLIHPNQANHLMLVSDIIHI